MMTGKEQFKAVKSEYVENIMTEYRIDKDTAYAVFAKILAEPRVTNSISLAVAEELVIAQHNKKSPMEQWLDEFFKVRV